MNFPLYPPETTIVMSHEALNVMKLPTLAEFKESVAGFVQKLDKLEKQVERKLVNPVNNYLKTPEEIEADLSYQGNFQGVAMAVEASSSRIILEEHKDGYINIHDPLSIDQGFMEENY